MLPTPLVAPSSPTSMGQLAVWGRWSLPSVPITLISLGQEYSGLPGVISTGGISALVIPVGGGYSWLGFSMSLFTGQLGSLSSVAGGSL